MFLEDWPSLFLVGMVSPPFLLPSETMTSVMWKNGSHWFKYLIQNSNVSNCIGRWWRGSAGASAKRHRDCTVLDTTGSRCFQPVPTRWQWPHLRAQQKAISNASGTSGKAYLWDSRTLPGSEGEVWESPAKWLISLSLPWPTSFCPPVLLRRGSEGTGWAQGHTLRPTHYHNKSCRDVLRMCLGTVWRKGFHGA